MTATAEPLAEQLIPGTADRSATLEVPPVAYLISRYPWLSHTFITREVTELRRLGMEIETVSVRAPADEEVLSYADRCERTQTHVLVPPRMTTLLTAHLRALSRRPAAYFSTLSYALRLRAGGPRAAIWQLFYFAEAILLWHHCVRRGTRHIHAHFANVSADVAMLAARFGGSGGDRGGRWTWSFSMHSQVAQRGDGATDFYDVVRHRLRAKVEQALFVACVSDFERSRLMTLVDPDHWRKLRVVRCGVDIDEFRPPRRDERADARLRILTVGRMLALKGHALLLEAVALRRAAGSPVRLTLVGDGPVREQLERLASDLGIDGDVTFAGAVASDRIHAYYAAADVFCLPSLAEGIPVVLMEAMATGLPVVATRIAGIPELVREGECGLLVVPGRGDVLAEALARLADSRELRRAMGTAARGRVAAEFERQRSARRLRAIFLESLRSAGCAS
jgi:colanic acid/amylovoran biosynthesis glycosyltransferase